MSVLPNVWPLNVGLPRLRLTGESIVLEPPRLRDWPEWEAVRRRNEDQLKPFEPSWPDDCLTRDFFKRRLKRQQWDWENNAARYFLIRLKNTDTLIGGININHLNLGAARHGSLGYWLDEAYQGRGLMTQSVRVIMDYMFIDLHLQRAQAACVPENEKSMRVLKRAGMCEEGFAKDYIQINGVWRDHHLFALTRQAYLSVA